MGFSRLDNLQIRRNHGTGLTILPGQALDDLIGTLSPFGKHHLHPRPVFVMLKPCLLPPGIEHHGHGMPFGLAVQRKPPDEGFPRPGTVGWLLRLFLAESSQ